MNTPAMATATPCLEQIPRSITWHFLTIRTPPDWRPLRRKTAPPAASPVMSAKSAAATAILLNAERLARGPTVTAWTMCIPAANGWRFLTVKLSGEWSPPSPTALPPAAFAVTAGNRDHLKGLHSKLVQQCEPGFHVLQVMSPVINDWPAEAPAEPPTAATGTIEGRAYHVALTHPQFGTLAVSTQRFDQLDADKILSEARPALVVPEVGQIAFGPC